MKNRKCAKQDQDVEDEIISPVGEVLGGRVWSAVMVTGAPMTAGAPMHDGSFEESVFVLMPETL